MREKRNQRTDERERTNPMDDYEDDQKICGDRLKRDDTDEERTDRGRTLGWHHVNQWIRTERRRHNDNEYGTERDDRIMIR